MITTIHFGDEIVVIEPGACGVIHSPSFIQGILDVKVAMEAS